MHRITAFVLCMLAQGAIAQCVAPTAAANVAMASTANPVVASEPVRPAGTSAVNANARPAPELIKTAAAGTRDDAPPAIRETTRHNGQDHPRRGGTAMLLAALALMSGIALRRYGAPRE